MNTNKKISFVCLINENEHKQAIVHVRSIDLQSSVTRTKTTKDIRFWITDASLNIFRLKHKNLTTIGTILAI